jgi:hypothetical protein
MNMGDRIQCAWPSFVRNAISAAVLRRELADLEWDECDDSDWGNG